MRRLWKPGTRTRKMSKEEKVEKKDESTRQKKYFCEWREE
jgi:hypothetical protein